MKDSGKTIILAIILSIVLFFAGLFLYGAIIELLLPEADKVLYGANEINAAGGDSLLFSFLLALMPIFIVCTWSFCSANKRSDKSSIAGIIIVFTFLTVFVRQQVIAAWLKKLTDTGELNSGAITLTYPVNRLGFELYMFAGLCASCILACIIYRRNRNLY